MYALARRACERAGIDENPVARERGSSNFSMHTYTRTRDSSGATQLSADFQLAGRENRPKAYFPKENITAVARAIFIPFWHGEIKGVVLVR